MVQKLPVANPHGCVGCVRFSIQINGALLTILGFEPRRAVSNRHRESLRDQVRPICPADTRARMQSRMAKEFIQATVVFQQGSEAFSTGDCSTAPNAPIIVRREQQEVVFTLVIPLCVVVLGELSYGASQQGSPKRINLDKHSRFAERTHRSAKMIGNSFSRGDSESTRVFPRPGGIAHVRGAEAAAGKGRPAPYNYFAAESIR